MRVQSHWHLFKLQQVINRKSLAAAAPLGNVLWTVFCIQIHSAFLISLCSQCPGGCKVCHCQIKFSVEGAQQLVAGKY